MFSTVSESRKRRLGKYTHPSVLQTRMKGEIKWKAKKGLIFF
jgi:hypothetical protein